MGSPGTISYGANPTRQAVRSDDSPEERAAAETVQWLRPTPSLILVDGEVVGPLPPKRTRVLNKAYGPPHEVSVSGSVRLRANIGVWGPGIAVSMGLVAVVWLVGRLLLLRARSDREKPRSAEQIPE